MYVHCTRHDSATHTHTHVVHFLRREHAWSCVLGVRMRVFIGRYPPKNRYKERKPTHGLVRCVMCNRLSDACWDNLAEMPSCLYALTVQAQACYYHELI